MNSYDNGLAQIVEALSVVHSSSSTSQQRREAQDFLESLKSKSDAPTWGWKLASMRDGTDNGIVRHFGLTLLHHSVQTHFITYDMPRKETIKNWVVELASDLKPEDPHYIKEKVAFLWAVVAERIWGIENITTETPDVIGWSDMDSSLLRLWAANSATRELVLSVFRTLFEDLFILDDPVAAKRSGSLSAQCIEVVNSDETLNYAYATRVPALKVLRSGQEGWLQRWSDLLDQCLQNGLEDPEAELFAIKVLETLKTCLFWVFPAAIRTTSILDRLSMALVSNNIKVQTLAVDCLQSFFTRNFNNIEDFQAIVGSVFSSNGISTLRVVYEGCSVDIDSVDENKYVFLRKFVELIVGLSEFIQPSGSHLSTDADIPGYLQLLLRTTNHPSLVLSGMSLSTWCSLLRIEKDYMRDLLAPILPSLLETAASRCLKYDDVEEENISIRFLEQDFDSTPDTQIFIGNYRHLIEDICRLAFCRIPLDSMEWLKNRVESFFQSEIGWQSLRAEKLTYFGNPSYYLAYSQFILIETALRGVTRWKYLYQESDITTVLGRVTSTVESICKDLISMDIQDPLLLRKLVQTLVQFAPLLKSDLSLMFQVLERVLTSATKDYVSNSYSSEEENDEQRELFRDLRTSCGTELNRLAYMIPETLMQIYDDLERVISEIVSSGKLSEHEAVAFKSFLLVVSQRAEVPNKSQRFANIVDPVVQSWVDETTVKGLMDLPWFMERVGIVKIAEYFRSRGVTENSDLLTVEMDDAGRKLKAELKDKWSELFPIRATRIFIQYTIEKLDHSGKEYKDLLALWKPRIQPILPHILQLISQIEAYHNPDNWTELPAEVQSFVKYSCTERFWQMGVSIKSKDEFLHENVKAMHTLRDFADSVGHIIRYTREYAFLALGSISQLEETMYEIPGMPRMLWLALAGDSAGITSHSWRHMILLVLRNVVKNCPDRFIESFMGEFLPPVLTKLDDVLAEKWAQVYERGLQLNGADDDTALSEEMMDEHLLRQLTSIVARFLIDLAGQYEGKNSSSGSERSDSKSHSAILRSTVLGNKQILAPALRLCINIMLYKDSKCSFNCCLVLRGVLPAILLQDEEVDAFLGEVLIKACLDILRDEFFADVHSEAGYILTLLYTLLRGKSQRPLEILSQLLQNVSPKDLIDFDTRLNSIKPKSLRQQRGMFLEFLSLVRAMDSPDGTTASREVQRRKMEQQQKPEKKLLHSKKNTSLMDDDDMDTGLNSLFGQ